MLISAILQEFHQLSHKTMSPKAKMMPIFMAHGTEDRTVQYEWGLESSKFLTDKLGFQSRKLEDLGSGVVFETYRGMEHSSDPRELRDLTLWLKHAIPESA